jgi:outer membrane protein OmpA-like peptidoglycan-associated protein
MFANRRHDQPVPEGTRRAVARRPEPALSAKAVLALQRTAGNQAVARALQQRPRERKVARLLKATGDVKRFRALVEPAIGQELIAPYNGAIRLGPKLATPALSMSLAEQLTGIIKDGSNNAEVEFGSHQTGIVGGDYDKNKVPVWPPTQRIDLDDIEALEAGQPGYGLAVLAHEITENYAAHLKRRGDGVPNDRPHQAGIAAENDVMRDLVGPGERVAERNTADSRAGSATVSATVIDFELYYMVFTVTANPQYSGGQDLTISDAARAERIDVASHSIEAYTPGSDVAPPAAAAQIAAALAELKAHPMATARVEGFADPTGPPALNGPLSDRRARNVAHAIAANGPLSRAIHTVGRGVAQGPGDNDTEAGRAENRRVVITISEPSPGECKP